MTLFRFPKTWCDDIAKLIARLWWNGRDDRRRIHSVWWNRLTMPKYMGGMGFKDVTDFNTTMLTKTTWRLHEEQDSLWIQVMKGVYFPKGK